MKLAVVVQRYGDDVAGGAELHARYVAELLAGDHDVTVLTTTARDYLTWKPHYPAGETTVGGVRVVRFPVTRERDEVRFAAAAARAYGAQASDQDERLYLEEQGPVAPQIGEHIRADRGRYDAIIAFSYRYLTTQEAALAAPDRTLLVPTAEHDAAIGLATSHHLFRSVAAIAYNTPEERAMILAAAGNDAVPGDEVGIFSRIATRTDPTSLARRQQIDGPYVVYVGRIDRNKGCDRLFQDFAAWSAETALPHRLLLLGRAVLDVPVHPMIQHLGFVPDQDKFDAIAGAEVLLMPSPYESLSMVTLEAFALATPALVNGTCAVLRGQVQRAQAGLYYTNYEEFFEALKLLALTPRLRAALGANGQRFYRANYAEPVIKAKYERLLAHITAPRSS